MRRTKKSFSTDVEIDYNEQKNVIYTFEKYILYEFLITRYLLYKKEIYLTREEGMYLYSSFT